MGNLKMKKRKVNQVDIARLASKIKAVNDGISMKLIRYVEGEATVYIWPQILVGVDLAYQHAFVDNLWTYWKIHSGKLPEETANMELTVKHADNEDTLFTFSDKKGITVF